MADPDRIVADGLAKEASRKLLGVLETDLPLAFKKLRRSAQHLNDRNHWDGRAARDFSRAWDEMERSVEQFQESLRQSQRKVTRTLENISRAGGNH
jgi:uncharacterized protein YukE